MSSSASAAQSSRPHPADALAGAERRRAVLQRLTEIGMALAEEIADRNVHAPLHPEPRHEMGRAFASVSRAVRLTVVLEGRIEAEIFAIRNGLPIPVVEDPRRAASAEAPEAVDDDRRDPETETDPRDRLYESLVDREDDDALLALPFDACVDAIRAGLSLPRSGEGGLAASGREPGGGWARGLESWEASEAIIPDIPISLHPALACRRESPSPLRGREGSG
jgi:hypothetical protein